MTILEQQLDELRKEFGDAQATPLQDGSTLITIPDVPLQAWNKPSTTIYFIAPVGYPLARPDCFWADEDLRPASAQGALPKSSGIQQPPFPGGAKLWFSWHPSTWTPNRDNLKRYLRIVQDRLARGE